LVGGEPYEVGTRLLEEYKVEPRLSRVFEVEHSLTGVDLPEVDLRLSTGELSEVDPRLLELSEVETRLFELSEVETELSEVEPRLTTGERTGARLLEARETGVRESPWLDMFGVWCLVAVSKCVRSRSTTVLRDDVLSIDVANFNGCFDWLSKFSAILIGQIRTR
jgi:hypothetical protein